jgi:hypothetical protein
MVFATKARRHDVLKEKSFFSFESGDIIHVVGNFSNGFIFFCESLWPGTAAEDLEKK